MVIDTKTDKTPRIVKVDGTEVPITPKNGKDFKFDEIQAALKMEGNPDPTFTMAGTVDGMLMLAEDNGFALGLPRNPKASEFYVRACGGRTDNPIVGNVVVMPKKMMK